MKTQDELVTLIGSPPTAVGIAAAILAATSADVVPDAPPEDHGLHPDDPAVTGVPRDETVPTPGVDLPATDTSPPPVETLAPKPPDAPLDGSAPAGPAIDPAGDSPEVIADKAAVQADEDKLATDEAQLKADEDKLFQ